MARKTIAERMEELNDLLEEANKVKASIAKLRKGQNFVGQAILIRAAQIALKVLVARALAKWQAKRRKRS